MKESDSGDKAIKEKMATLGQKMEKAQAEVQPVLFDFLVALGKEGERSAVVLGAERVNVSVEALLKRFLRPCPNERDSLFGSDGALGTFSRKIEMAYRLGLIDAKFRQALDIVRKLRNEFAHAVTVESLQEQKHADRVKALSELMKKGNESAFTGLLKAFQQSGEQAQTYLSCIMLLLIKLETVSRLLERPDILVPAKVDYRRDDPD